jgi:hypothetical protein
MQKVLITTGFLVALTTPAPAEGLPAGVKDTLWNQIVVIALKQPHTMTEKCSGETCISTIRFKMKGTKYRLIRRAIEGHEWLTFCKENTCEAVN